MRRVLAAVFWTGLFLLLLSTLVVTPESASAVNIAPPSPAVFYAVVLPPSPAPFSSTEMTSLWENRLCAAYLPLLAWFAVFSGVIHDSNGRVLTAARYENSVYQVFRPEVAGG